MRWLVLAFVTVAAPALAQPSIAGVDPHSVRAGGTIVVQIDTNDYQGPIIVSVFRQHPPLLAKHVSKLLEDNKPGDDAPQVGIIKYRIKTDDSWLSTIDLKTNLATSEEQYKISIISGSLQSINAPTAKASLQPLEFARVITVLGHEGPLDQDAVLEGDLNLLVNGVSSLRALSDLATVPFDVYSKGADTKASADWMAVEVPPTKANKFRHMNETTPMYVMMNPSVWARDGQMVDAGDVRRMLLAQERDQLVKRTREIEASLTPDQRKKHASKLNYLRGQLALIEQATPKQ